MTWLKNLLKKIWDFIRPILAVILICIAIYLTFGGAIPWLTALMPGFTGGWAALAALGAAFFIDSETVVGVADTVATAAGEVLQTVVDVGADVAGSIFSQPIFLVAAGLALWWFLGRNKDRQTIVGALGSEDEDKNQGGTAITSNLQALDPQFTSDRPLLAPPDDVGVVSSFDTSTLPRGSFT